MLIIRTHKTTRTVRGGHLGEQRYVNKEQGTRRSQYIALFTRLHFKEFIPGQTPTFTQTKDTRCILHDESWLKSGLGFNSKERRAKPGLKSRCSSCVLLPRCTRWSLPRLCFWVHRWRRDGLRAYLTCSLTGGHDQNKYGRTACLACNVLFSKCSLY
jgi:hypothetical protein